METPRQFEWDEAKAAVNERKHRVSFDLAVEVFFDVNRLDRPDDRRDYGEERRNTIGFVDGFVLVVTYTMRSNVCRIISARLASRKERIRYADRTL